MLKKKVVHILALITLVVGIILPALGQTVRAAGNDISSNIVINNVNISDGKGGTINNGEETDSGNSGYFVSMDWSYTGSGSIKNGDTATFTIPNNVVPNGKGPYNLYAPDKTTIIGSFTLDPDSNTGTMIFNDNATNLGNSNIKGSLNYYGTGTTTNNQSDWNINKIGSLQENGTILWSVAVKDGSSVTKIIDSYGENQTFDKDSVQIQTGSFDDKDNHFIADNPQKEINYTVTDDNSGTATIDFNPSFNGGLYITYTTTPDDPKNGVYKNTATLTGGPGDGSSVTKDITIGGSGNGDGLSSTDTSITTTSSTTDTTPTTDTSSTTTSSTTDTTPTTDTSSTTTTSSTTDTTSTTDTSSTTTSSSTTPSTSNPTNPNTDTSSSTTDTTPITDTSSTTTSSSTTPSTSNPTNPNTDTSSTTSTDVPHSAKPDTDTDTTTGTHTAGVPGVNNNGGHTNGKLPQTGQKDTKGLTIIGTAMLLMLLAMFGYIKVRKFNK